jgi:hypothetical protein
VHLKRIFALRRACTGRKTAENRLKFINRGSAVRFSHGLHFLGHSAFAFETALPAPLLPSNRRKLVFRSMPVTQEKETLHHPPATTSLIAAMSWLSPLTQSRCGWLDLIQDRVHIGSLKFLCEFGRHRRSASNGRGYLKDAAIPVSIQHKKSATRLIEANIARTNTGHCGEGQPSPLNHVVAHRFNDVGDGRRNRADMASVKHNGRRRGGLQNSRKGRTVIDADRLERDSETSRH